MICLKFCFVLEKKDLYKIEYFRAYLLNIFLETSFYMNKY